jgi:hypothetical protein
MTHIIKLQEQFCDAVLSGDKCFEIRNNDRGYQKGDRVRFVSVAETGPQAYHEIDWHEYEITYVLSGWGLKEGYVAFGIKEVKQ